MNKEACDIDKKTYSLKHTSAYAQCATCFIV